MARPREFDETAVLDAAMRCFWAQGYEQTSVRELAAHMGITGASLYNAFGDKRALYRRALDYYLTQSVHDRIARLSPLPPLQAIRAFFGEIIERSVADEQRRGCLLVNAALEMAPHDPEFREIVVREMRLIEEFFRRSVEAGQTDGSIVGSPPASDLAKLLLSVLLGLRVLARTQPERPMLQGAVTPALSLLASCCPCQRGCSA
ncbi:MAG: TetR/AcrR family transcriptional regulator [Alphaproteobacteria bacterium]|nr:TetR/AcrR family transcriptional regulator [Alphaproteobacteria bacterium]